MGMILNFLRVSQAELDQYLEDSSLLETKVYENDDDGDDPNLKDIDKSWEGILFLLTGNNLSNIDHPLAKVLFSGQLIDEDQDMGYGPANYLSAEEVKSVNQQLSKITDEDLKKAFDGEKMNKMDIYPNIWNDEGTIDYLVGYFQTVKEIYSTAASNDQAIITFLN